FDISALVTPAAGATTFGNARAISVPAFDVSDLVAPTFGDARAVGVPAFDVSDLITPAVGAPTFGNAPAAGALAADYSAFAAPAVGALAADIPTIDLSAFAAPAAGAPTFGDALAVGAPTFCVTPAVGVSDLDISDLFAPAAGTTTFGDAPAVGVSAFGAPAAGAPTFGVAPAVGMPDLDISALVAPAAGTTTFGVAPAAGILDRDFSDFFTPAVGATTFGNAPVVNISDLDISAFVAPAVNVPVDATQAAAIPNDNQPIGCHLAAQARVHRAPCDDVPESSLLAKRRRVDRHVSDSGTKADTSCMLRDISGRRVTSERLLVALGKAPYISLGYVLDAYRYIYGCELMPRTIPSQYCIATLARVVALEHWAPHLEGEDSEEIAGLNILCRRDLERTELRQNYREQLGLVEDSNAAVLGPRLCYIIVKMCSMSVDHLSGPILRSMFMDATGLDLHALNVVTEKGVQRMGANIICRMVKDWTGDLSKFVSENGSMRSLRAATQCNAAYSTRCGGDSNNTSVALGILSNNKHNSRLLLGVQAPDFDSTSMETLAPALLASSFLIYTLFFILRLPTTMTFLNAQPQSTADMYSFSAAAARTSHDWPFSSY
ncbi:hypothetical protein GGI03_004618, partial [Coemansia sp. RSA 2337]